MHDLDTLRAALQGRYDVTAELGRGGMGTVYIATDLRHGRRVAIKVLQPELTKGIGLQRFLREIEIAARLQHPNILPLHDSGEHEGSFYYIMPYVEGESLRERLDREKQLPIDDALQIAREVADALSYAHEQGVIHRDVKPENILISGGHPIIADFGIARAISKAGGERVTETGHAVGTPAYMSPEQAGGESHLDGRTDIYALGCVLFEMLAGEPPFTGRTAQAVIARHMLERPPLLHAVRPSVPPPVVAAIETALSKSPADRFATASDFKVSLEVATEKRFYRRALWKTYAQRPARLVVPLALLIAAAASIATWLFWPAAARLDPNKVVVFPLIARGLEPDERVIGWDLAITIESALEHAYPLKSINGWSRLPEPIRDNTLLLTPELAREVSKERQAAFYIDGVVGRDPGSSSVVLRLHDVRGDSLVAQETARDTGQEITYPQLALRAIRVLLPKILDPGREFDLSPLNQRDPAAIALWIQGERAYRQSYFKAALGFYERAVQEDSLLVFAAIKGAQAAEWKKLSPTVPLLEAALSHDSLLPSKYAHLAHGFQAYLSGNSDTAQQHFEAALAEDPDWSEGAMALGEVYYHLLPAEGSPDSIAAVWFNKALAADSAFTPPMMHLAEIAVRRGDLDAAENLVRRLAHVEPDSMISHRLPLILACARRGPAAIDWLKEARANPSLILRTAKELSVGAYYGDCAKEGFKAVLATADAPPPLRWGALVGLQGLLVAEGRDVEAEALLDSTLAAGTGVVRVLYILNVFAGAKMGTKAAEVAEFSRSRFGAYYEGARPQFKWLLGIWHAHLGDAEKVEAIAEGIFADASESGSASDRMLADALFAHSALQRGDTSAALALLRGLSPRFDRNSLAWGWFEPLGVERLVLARLLLDLDDYEGAYAVASVFDHPGPVIFLPFLPSSLRIRLQAAEALGRTQLADRLKTRLLSLRVAEEYALRSDPK